MAENSEDDRPPADDEPAKRTDSDVDGGETTVDINSSAPASLLTKFRTAESGFLALLR